MAEGRSEDGIVGTLLAALGALLLVLSVYAAFSVFVWVGDDGDGPTWTPQNAAAAVLTAVWEAGALITLTSRDRRQRNASAITLAAVVGWAALAFDWTA